MSTSTTDLSRPQHNPHKRDDQPEGPGLLAWTMTPLMSSSLGWASARAWGVKNTQTWSRGSDYIYPEYRLGTWPMPSVTHEAVTAILHEYPDCNKSQYRAAYLITRYCCSIRWIASVLDPTGWYIPRLPGYPQHQPSSDTTGIPYLLRHNTIANAQPQSTSTVHIYR
jgi:hypothetical protein